MRVKDGGPAFPQVRDEVIPDVQRGSDTPAGATWAVVHPGMSLRDYFAAHALVIMSNPKLAALGRPLDGTPSDEWIARGCYELADAMLKAREV